MDIILASSSPRRHQLLSHLSYSFSTFSVNIDEGIYDNEMPDSYIKRIVNNKSKAAINMLLKQKVSKNILLITADTIGVIPNTNDILVKPVSKQHAFSMWSKMSDTYHQVWTCIQGSLVDVGGQIVWTRQYLIKTDVYFTTLSIADMEAYWQTDEPHDKAGGYAIQGIAARWVSKINGSYTNVVGLPLVETKALIVEAENFLKVTY